MLAPWLDEELARQYGGVAVGGSRGPGDAAGWRARAADTGRSLDRLVDRAQNPRPPSLIRLVPRCREQVSDAMPLILKIRFRLLSGDSLAPAGIAGLKKLLSDRCGPCYILSETKTLTLALQGVMDSLEGDQIAPS